MGRTMLIENMDFLEGDQRVVLEQIEGPGKGRTFAVLPLKQIVIGRGGDVEIELEDSAISRKHAKIVFVTEHPVLMDLQSSNGTYLNNDRTDHANLKHGDLIRMGECRFRVSFERGNKTLGVTPVSADQAKSYQAMLTKPKKDKARRQSVLSGNLDTLNLPSLLQIIEMNGAAGTLLFRNGDQKGQIYVKGGRLEHCTHGTTSGEKAFYRLASMEKGRFEFFAPGRTPRRKTLDHGVQELILESMRVQDELPAYIKELPPLDTRVSFNPTVSVSLHKIPSPVFDVMAAVSRFPRLQDTLDQCPLSDLLVCRILLALLKQRVLMEGDGDTPLAFQSDIVYLDEMLSDKKTQPNKTSPVTRKHTFR